MTKAKSTVRRKSKPAAPASAADSSIESGAPAAVSADARQRMIAEAAYFRAAARGFQGGDPVDDWLAAEAEVDRAWSAKKQ